MRETSNSVSDRSPDGGAARVAEAVQRCSAGLRDGVSELKLLLDLVDDCSSACREGVG